MTRKEFLARSLGIAGLALGLAGGLGGCQSSSATGDAPCDDPAGLPEVEQRRRKSSRYVSQTPLKDKTCANCEFYIEKKKGATCGECKLFAGPVAAAGYCEIWVQI